MIGLLPGNENYYKRGQIIQQLADFRFVNQPWRVHQRTDYRDWQAQLELVREISPVPPRPSCSTIMRSSTFWKVITE